MQLQAWLQQSQQRLIMSDSASLDSVVLASFVLNRPRSWMIAYGDSYQLQQDELQRLEELLQRRCLGEPIAYLTGEREFWSLPLRVNPTTLIPRPDTEILVEQALLKISRDKHACVLDLGTGSGAIALAIAKERPLSKVTGVDRFKEVVALAEFNAHSLGIANCQFIQSNWFGALGNKRYQIIVSNPPYIASNDPHLQQGDVRFEPHSALTADEQGLADLREIITTSLSHLLSGGWLLVEHGYQQAMAVQTLFVAAGFEQVVTVNDYSGNPRVTCGCLIDEFEA